MTPKPRPKCAVCSRDPQRMNSDVAECSHVQCPHRRRCWSEQVQPEYRGPWPQNTEQDPMPLDVEIGAQK